MIDVAIIGSGPAGYTAAIYASRAALGTTIIGGPQPGGQLTTTTEIENFPGFPNGILGPQLMSDLRTQAERFGTTFLQQQVTSIKAVPGGGFDVLTDGETIRSRTVIIATGAQAKELGIPSEKVFRGKGVSYCATCDGFFFRGKKIAVLGGGDTAMEEALYLTKFASSVTIIHRRDQFRASAVMLERARKNEKITFLTHKLVKEFHGESAVKSISLTDAVSGQQTEFPIEGVFVAIGHTPATGFLKGILELTDEGYIELTKTTSSTEPQTLTSIPGIFAAGDCVDPRYRQGVVAAGMGAMAAIDAERWLEI